MKSYVVKHHIFIIFCHSSKIPNNLPLPLRPRRSSLSGPFLCSPSDVQWEGGSHVPMRTRGGTQMSVWIAVSSGLSWVSRPAGHPLCCLLQYGWLLWQLDNTGCHLCLLPCWCLEIVRPLWFLELWLLAAGSLWGITDNLQVLSGHLLHSALELGIQWSLDCYLYLPIICKWSKHLPSGGFFCLPGWFSGSGELPYMWAIISFLL